jgi:adenylate cyclase
VSPEIVYEMEGRTIVVPLDKDEITIGRSTINDLVIAHPTVSRKHAKLYRDGNSWRVMDLGSTYGTRVNNLGHANTVLRSGDRIFLHRFPLTFVDRSAPDAALTPDTDHVESFGMRTVFKPAVDFTALASSQEDAQHLRKLLGIVTRASEAILASRSLDDTFQRVLDLVFEHLPVQRGFIMLWDPAREDLITRCVKLHPGMGGPNERIQFSRTIAEKVYREKVGVLTTDALVDSRFSTGASIQALGIRSAMAAPLCNGDNVDGLIYVDTPLQRRAFNSVDLDLLSALGNQVSMAIEQSRLQESVMEQEQRRRRLERYHSPAVVARIEQSHAETGPGMMAEEREVTVLFADVVNFSDRVEHMEPKDVAGLLNRYFSEMTDVVFRHDGTLDKFIGDCLMAVFGAPLAQDDHARRAVEAALEMREALNLLNEPLPPEARVQFRVGINTGRAVAGDIGSIQRRDYTVLGATVNLAARIEAQVARPGQIVITESTREAVAEFYETRPLGEHQPRGFSRKVSCHELIGRKDSGS